MYSAHISAKILTEIVKLVNKVLFTMNERLSFTKLDIQVGEKKQISRIIAFQFASYDPCTCLRIWRDSYQKNKKNNLEVETNIIFI